MHNNVNITGVWKIPHIQLHLSVDYWDKQRAISHRRPASSGSLSLIYFSVHSYPFTIDLLIFYLCLNGFLFFSVFAEFLQFVPRACGGGASAVEWAVR